MTEPQHFSTTLFLTGNNTGIEVPAEVVEALGRGKRPPVTVTVNGFSYPSTVAVMGGKYLLPFAADKRAATGLGGGDAIDVTLELDSAPRIVDVPDDLAGALAAIAGAREAFDALAPSVRKIHVTAVLGAKAAETRARRIAAIVTKLGFQP